MSTSDLEDTLAALRDAITSDVATETREDLIKLHEALDQNKAAFAAVLPLLRIKKVQNELNGCVQF